MYTVAGSLIIYEYSRNEAKNAAKAQVASEKEAKFRADLDQKFGEMQSTQVKLSERLDAIENRLQKLQSNQSVSQLQYRFFILC
jgi:predicted  nucleic acid-binding Zn-ribbon protein